MIAHIEPGPNTAYLEQGFSTGDPRPGIRFQWILSGCCQLAKGCFFVLNKVSALGFNCSVGLAVKPQMCCVIEKWKAEVLSSYFCLAS